MTDQYGYFDDSSNGYVVDSPTPPRPWINYLGNRQLNAFISQNAGGLIWYKQPYSGRISRYHYTAAPGDRPGFYLYIKNQKTDKVWNPHFAPTCTPLDHFRCVHQPGITRFDATVDHVRACATYTIPPDDKVMLWHLSLTNASNQEVNLEVASYLEFGLLEFMREAIGWCYLRNHFSLHYDEDLEAIHYDYHVFEAPITPTMLFGSTRKPDAWECSRDAFIGRTGSLGHPESLSSRGFANSDLPVGGHACAVESFNLTLAPNETYALGFCFALGDNFAEATETLNRYRSNESITHAIQHSMAFWSKRLDRCMIKTPDPIIDRAINTWIPYNSVIALDLARTISTDHMGTDGLRYRDTTQDAMAVTQIDPEFAQQRMEQVFQQQQEDGAGCFAFYPGDTRSTSDAPDRSDNTVWQVDTVYNLIAETGNIDWLNKPIAYRSGATASVYEHILKGLQFIANHCGPHGLPRLKHADWNDGLALFGDTQAESVMLAMQMVHACNKFIEFADWKSDQSARQWCEQTASELTQVLNSDLVWDGQWYRRLLLSNGTALGSADNPEGKIFINPQSWAVISGIGQQEHRGKRAMQAVAELLDTDCGCRILAPPFTGIPTPDDPPLGSNPGIGENGGIFCHANSWAVIAEAMLGNANQAFKYFKQLLPEVLAARKGHTDYQREPYVYVSSVVGPDAANFGEGGISWLTGTANWMYVAFVHYIAGILPTWQGLQIAPCLPDSLEQITIKRKFRDTQYLINIHNAKRDETTLSIDGKPATGNILPISPGNLLKIDVQC